MVKDGRKKKTRRNNRSGMNKKLKETLTSKSKRIAGELIKAHSLSSAVMTAATKAGKNRLSQEATQATPAAQQENSSAVSLKPEEQAASERILQQLSGDVPLEGSPPFDAREFISGQP